MCGIYGVIENNAQAADLVYRGLKRLEYRGYDSWGIATSDANNVAVKKFIGAISTSSFEPKTLKGRVGLGHTRWATHGGISIANTHPHHHKDTNLVLAHNGIVENYETLLKRLQKDGITLQSQTDSEVILQLIAKKVKTGKSVENAILNTFKILKGRNAIVLLDVKNERLLAIKTGSPLVVGQGKSGNFIASDTLSIANQVKNISPLKDNQLVSITKDQIMQLKDNKITTLKMQKHQLQATQIDKGGHQHFMLKEINEIPSAITNATNIQTKTLAALVKKIKSAQTVYTIGAGTAGIAANQIAYFLRQLANINAIALTGYEATSYRSLFTKNDLVIAVSQSGETADVLEVLEWAKNKGTKIAAIVNMLGSTMLAIADYPFTTNSGPEISVVSTKVFVAQVCWGYLVAKAVSQKTHQAKETLNQASKRIERLLKNPTFLHQVKKIAKDFSKKEHLYLLGKGQNYMMVQEGMVKICETDYIHAQAFSTGELKHYAIALIEKHTPCIFAISSDENENATLNAANEVKARGAYVLTIGPKPYKVANDHLIIKDMGELSCLNSVIAFQLIAYYIGTEKKAGIDRPRNLAKSVTVK